MLGTFCVLALELMPCIPPPPAALWLGATPELAFVAALLVSSGSLVKAEVLLKVGLRGLSFVGEEGEVGPSSFVRFFLRKPRDGIDDERFSVVGRAAGRTEYG